MTLSTRPRPAEPSSPPVVATAPGPGPACSGLALSPRGYWLLSGVIVAAYLLLWVTHFDYVYGLIFDDYVYFLKALETLGDWKSVFALWNEDHLYYFALAYIP